MPDTADPVATAEALDDLLSRVADETGLDTLDDARGMLHAVIVALEDVGARLVAALRVVAASDRLMAENDRLRDAFQQAWAERNEARSTVGAVRALAEKWGGEPTDPSRFLANAILAIVGEPAATFTKEQP